MVTQQIALGVGANGALVDVSSYVTGPEGVQYSYGRQNEFRDPSPGQVTFILDNYDGRFTPGNTNSPLATLLTEGTTACWKLGSRLVAGVVSAIGFAGAEDQWGRVSITVGDSIYIAGRSNLQNLAASILMGASPYMFWPFNDPAGSAQALEQSGNNAPALRYLPDPVDGTLALTFGTASTGPTGDNQLSVVATNLSQSVGYSFGTGKGPKVTYPSGSLGAWGFWYTPGASSYLSLNVLTNTLNYSVTLTGWTAQVVLQSTTGASLILPASTSAMYVSLVLTYDSTNVYATLNVNGVALQTVVQFFPGYNTPTVTVDHVLVLFTPNSGGVLATYQTSISHLSHTAALVHEEWAGVTSEANRWAALTSIVPQITSGSVDANLSAAPVATQNTSGSSALAALLDLLRTEQGHIYNTTTGTLTAPTTVTNFRARTRPTTVKASFDAQLEVDGLPQFVRDVTNMFATITATGPTNSATVTDPAAVSRVGSTSTSETVLLATPTDLMMYAQDRLVRGENVSLRIVSVTINMSTTPTDRSADLLGLVPGDRIRISNIPSASLGFSTWDGWFLGASETHNYQSDAFTLFLAPVLPPAGIFDTDLFAAGGDLSLSASLTAAATSMTVASSDGTRLETVQVPYALYIDQEQVTVTACTAPSGGIQTATITRAAGGTTGATHALGALVDVAPSSIYAF